MENYVIGIDFGTDSVRSVVVDTLDGRLLASSVHAYSRWAQGAYCDPATNLFRQHPSDYVEGLEATVRDCVAQLGEKADRICAIGIDTTGSTPAPVDVCGVPLALHPEFADDPDAMFFLWKDHRAVAEADEINRLAAGTPYLSHVGGSCSPEWFWAKLLYMLRHNSRVGDACCSWVEHCDWIPYLLTGGTHLSQLKRSVCAAGHKGLYAPEWNGFPPAEFFAALDNRMARIASQLSGRCPAAGTAVGAISKEWAGRLGLPETTVVGVGSIDAHTGAVGACIEPHTLCMVVGTSTCDMIVVPETEYSSRETVPGICGSVADSIVPGMIGMEAGQAAFGDIYNWFRQLLVWPIAADGSGLSQEEQSRLCNGVLDALNREAARIQPDESCELAIDWFNGRRSPDSDPLCRGALYGLNLGSDAPRIYRALVEATCFGTKAIVERFRNYGVPLDAGIALGGISRKSPFVMQMLADVLDMPIRVCRSPETCALGATMYAAVAAELYESVETAMQAMSAGFDRTYLPDKNRTRIYDLRYEKYKSLGGMIK